MTVRTRVAPSPTGDPHVGTAYVALFNMVFARSQQGQFILRIEDTDRARSTAQAEQAILDQLNWLGLTWDEGPDTGGPHGPYRQSERAGIYRKHSEFLLKEKHAFHCFCTRERLQALREQQMTEQKNPGYDGHCLQLTAEDVAQNLRDNKPHVIRMKVPQNGQCVIRDLLRGDISIDWDQVDMQVLVKEDGMPTYHLANVVDDHLMKITHVIRGEEWISSAPKHKLLYDAFGWDMPVLCHLPLLRNPDKSKLSKRRNPVSIGYYRDAGFLPETMLNYLARMGWSMPDGQEKFTLQEMTQHFDISRISLGGPVFDVQKLSWLNGSRIRDLSDEELLKALTQWRLNPAYMKQFLPLARERIETLGEFIPLSSFMFCGVPAVTPEDFAHKKLAPDEVCGLLQFVLWRLEETGARTHDEIFSALSKLARQTGHKTGELMTPVFVAIAGNPDSWSVTHSMEILGTGLSRARLRHAITVLGGFSKKELKRQEKAYKRLNAGGT